MSETGVATQHLDAALDRLKACRASDKDYIAASENVLVEMSKLGPLGPNTPDGLANLYQKLTKSFFTPKNVLNCAHWATLAIRVRKRQNIDYSG